MAEELIKIKGIGFGVRVDRRRKCNLISPLLLDFFDIRGTQNEGIGGCLLDYRFDDIFRYVGRAVARCSDNKLRRCKVYKACFEYEGRSFTLPFHLDRSLEVPATMGQVFCDKE